MARMKCPKCKSSNISMLGVKTKTKLDINPLHPFTLTKQVPTKVQTFACQNCGRRFEQSIR